MCMEDIKLGRELQSQMRVVAVGVGVVQLCGASRQRTRLIFQCGTVGVNTFIAPNDSAVSLTTGILITSTKGEMILRVEDYGNLVTQAWFGIGSGAAANIIVIESVLERMK